MDSRHIIYVIWLINASCLLALFSAHETLLRPTNLTTKILNGKLVLSWKCNIPEEMLESTKFRIYFNDYEYNEFDSSLMDANIKQLSVIPQLKIDFKVVTVINDTESENRSAVITFRDEGELRTKAENVSCIIYNDTMKCTWAFGKNAPVDTNYSLYLIQMENEKQCRQYEMDTERMCACIIPDLNLDYFTKTHLIIEGSSKKNIQIFVDEFEPAQKEIISPTLNILVFFTAYDIYINWSKPFAVYNSAYHCFYYEIQVNRTSLMSYKVEAVNKYTLPLSNSVKKCWLKMRAMGTYSCGLSENWGKWSKRVYCGDAIKESRVDNRHLFIIIGIIAVVILAALCMRMSRIFFPPIPQPHKKFRSIKHHCGENKMQCKCVQVQVSLTEESNATIEEIPQISIDVYGAS